MERGKWNAMYAWMGVPARLAWTHEEGTGVLPCALPGPRGVRFRSPYSRGKATVAPVAIAGQQQGVYILYLFRIREKIERSHHALSGVTAWWRRRVSPSVQRWDSVRC